MSAIDGEQALGATIVVNGAHAVGTAGSIKAAAPTGAAYTFSKAYAVRFNGHQVNFAKGRTYILSPDQKTLFLASAAPMTAA